MKKGIMVTTALLIMLTLAAATSYNLKLVKQEKQERPKPEEVLNKLDANRDKKISKEEAKGPLKKNFGKIDGNNDSYITLEELINAPKPPKKKDPKK